VIVAYPVNIYQLSVKCRWTVSVCEGVNDYGIFSKYFLTFGEMPTEKVRRWGFLRFFYKILLNIKNKKIKLNNIHYKLNVFPKKY